MTQDPSTDVTRTLLALTGEILQRQVTEDLDLLSAGMDSIGAMELAARLEEELGVLCSLTDIFDADSLADLARSLTGRIDVAIGR